MILHGDSLEEMRKMDENSLDAIVTDPPYGWRFMGKAWDVFDIEKMASEATGKDPRMCADGRVRKPRQSNKAMAAGKYDLAIEGNRSFQKWTEEWAREALRVLKPGGHMLVFCGPRTYHRMASGVDDAGFEIRDQIQWIFGSGFPKSHNIGKATQDPKWAGFGTALKPANEPILLARKPLSEKTVAANVLRWGCGGLNIDASRIGTDLIETGRAGRTIHGSVALENKNLKDTPVMPPHIGRFPSNLLFSHNPDCVEDCTPGCAVSLLDRQSGVLKQGIAGKKSRPYGDGAIYGTMKEFKPNGTETYACDNPSGASRFFYCAKSSKRDKGADNTHPTCKSTTLMAYLIRLVTPPGGLVLDPFAGSGSTGVAALREGFRFIGIENELEYVQIAVKRLESVL